MLKRIVFALYLHAITLLLGGCVTFQGPPKPSAQPPSTTQQPPQTKQPKVDEERSFNTYVEDEKLEGRISDALNQGDPEFADAHINIYCFNGVALLTGEVPSRVLQQKAGKTAQQQPGVKQVHNQLLVKSNASVASRAYDKWLGSKLKVKLMGMDDIESEHVKVIVENQIVYLMGLLTESEADQVSELAATVGGVEKVVKVFEYTR